MINYYQKYIKYKSKYIKTKEQIDKIGGSFNINDIISVLNAEETPKVGYYGWILVGLNSEGKKFLIKMQPLVEELPRKNKRIGSPIINGKRIAYRLDKIENFKKENNILSDIYEKSKSLDDISCEKYHQIGTSICPEVYGLFVLNKEDSFNFLNKLVHTNDYAELYKEIVKTWIENNKDWYLGFSIMEYLENFETVKSIIDDQSISDELKKDLYEGSLCLLSDLHKIGYIHLDFHLENILYNRELKLLKMIDFGESITEDDENKICKEIKLDWIKSYESILSSEIEIVKNMISKYKECGKV